MKLDYATVLCIAYIPAENTPIVDTVATPETSLSVSITYSPLTSLVPRPYRSENHVVFRCRLKKSFAHVCLMALMLLMVLVGCWAVRVHGEVVAAFVMPHGERGLRAAAL